MHLKSRMTNMCSVVKPPVHNTITATASDQLRMDVESDAFVRAAEEVLVLTRELKDLWLFGGLNTQTNGKEDDGKTEEDAKVVYDFLQKMVNGTGGKKVNGSAATEHVVDGEMEIETT